MVCDNIIDFCEIIIDVSGLMFLYSKANMFIMLIFEVSIFDFERALFSESILF